MWRFLMWTGFILSSVSVWMQTFTGGDEFYALAILSVLLALLGSSENRTEVIEKQTKLLAQVGLLLHVDNSNRER